MHVHLKKSSYLHSKHSSMHGQMPIIIISVLYISDPAARINYYYILPYITITYSTYVLIIKLIRAL